MTTLNLQEGVEMAFSPPLDKGIAHAVIVLQAGGVETYESCEGGEGHAYTEPTIRFHGDQSEGWRALSIALQNGMPVRSLNRAWQIIDGEPVGPTWELVLWKKWIPSSSSEEPT